MSEKKEYQTAPKDPNLLPRIPDARATLPQLTNKEIAEAFTGVEDKAFEDFTFQPNSSDTLYSEDVSSIALAAMEVIEEGLKKHGVIMTDVQEDHIYLFVEREVERFGNGQYHHHH